MRIRVRGPDDLGELVAMATRVREVDHYPTELPDGDFRRFFTRPEPMAAWVADADGVVIGHVALNQRTSRPAMLLAEAHAREGSPVYVARLLVDPGARRRRVRQRLLAHARAAARTAGRRALLDVVDVARSAPAIRLYRRGGWDLVGTVSIELAGETVDELVFRAPPP